MKETIKDFLVGTFGVFGTLVYHAFTLALWLVIRIPIGFLGIPFWGIFLISIATLIPFIDVITLFVLWCITLPTVIGEPFSTLNCLYYIGLALFAYAYVVPVICSIIQIAINFIARVFRR